METLKTIFIVVLLIFGILLLVALIFSVIKTFIEQLTHRKRTEEAKKEFIDSLNELAEFLNKLETEEKPKKKTTKRTKKTEEE